MELLTLSTTGTGEQTGGIQTYLNTDVTSKQGMVSQVQNSSVPHVTRG